GIPAASATIFVEKDGENYRITATARTATGIDLFYKLRYRGEGLLSGTDLTPIRAVFDQQENSRIKNAEIIFHDNGEIEAVRQTKGKPAETLNFTPENFTLDPFAAAFIARGVDWKLGDTKEFDTFNGKSRYLISLTALEKAKVDVNGEKRDCWVISPKVKNL